MGTKADIRRPELTLFSPEPSPSWHLLFESVALTGFNEAAGPGPAS